jgi:hypothetical protein
VDHGCFNTVHPRNGVEDDVLLLAGIVRWDLRQADLAERDPLAGVWPTHCCIVHDIAVLAQLDLDAKLDRTFRDTLLDLVEEKVRTLGLRARVVEVLVARRGQNPVRRRRSRRREAG